MCVGIFWYYKGCSYFWSIINIFFLHLTGIVLWNKVNRQKCLYKRLLINSEHLYQKISEDQKCGFLVKCAKKCTFLCALTVKLSKFFVILELTSWDFSWKNFFLGLYFNSWETLHIQVGWKIQTFGCIFH